MITELLLTEKLRPKKFENLILSDRVKKSFPEGKLTQNILLSGSPGSGKTSTARILAAGHSTLYLNISSERGIDIVRDTITDFASTKSLNFEGDDDIKVVILDEMDGGSDLLFKALRATMEKFSKNTRFIGTCNYIQKIPEPILSRFLEIKYDPQTSDEEIEIVDKYIKRVEKVSDALKLKWENKNLLKLFIKKNFPDLRKIFSLLQDLSNKSQVITEKDLINSQFKFKEIFELIISKPDSKKNYQTITTNYSNKSNDIFPSLSTEFPEWIFDNYEKLIPKIPEMIISIAEWDYKRKFIIDENLGVLACLFQLQKIIHP